MSWVVPLLVLRGELLSGSPRAQHGQNMIFNRHESGPAMSNALDGPAVRVHSH